MYFNAPDALSGSVDTDGFVQGLVITAGGFDRRSL